MTTDTTSAPAPLPLLVLGQGTDLHTERGVECPGELPSPSDPDLVARARAAKAALGDKVGVRRFSSIAVPLDEALVEIALDLSGRPYFHYEVTFPGEKILSDPPFDPQLVEEFWRAFVVASAITSSVRR